MLIWIKRILLLAIVILAVVVGYWFTTENSMVVAVSLFGLPLPEISLGAVVILTLFAGGILGFLASLLPILDLTNQNLSLKRKLKRRDTELNRLRTAALKD